MTAPIVILSDYGMGAGTAAVKGVCKTFAPQSHVFELSSDIPALNLDAAADVSVLLTWWQLRDGVEDHGLFRGLKYRLSALLLRPAYRKARQFRPDLDKRMQERLQYLSALAREKCSVPDRAADAFSLLLRHLAALERSADRRRVLAELGAAPEKAGTCGGAPLAAGGGR